MSTTEEYRLTPLGDLDQYKVCAGECDPRGWVVVDSNGVQLGCVFDLIIDVEALTARYMLCSISRGRARSVLLPVGFARLDKDQCVVHLDFVTAADVDRLPAYPGRPSEEVIAQTEAALTGVNTTSPEAKIVRRSDTTRNAS
jgi:hypothetical protein